MQAIATDPVALGHLILKDVGRPQSAPSEALVRVAAISLNRGEVSVAGGAPADLRFGEDFAVTVERAAADGTGPQRRTAAAGGLRKTAERFLHTPSRQAVLRRPALPLWASCYSALVEVSSWAAKTPTKSKVSKRRISD